MTSASVDFLSAVVPGSRLSCLFFKKSRLPMGVSVGVGVFILVLPLATRSGEAACKEFSLRGASSRLGVGVGVGAGGGMGVGAGFFRLVLPLATRSGKSASKGTNSGADSYEAKPGVGILSGTAAFGPTRFFFGLPENFLGSLGFSLFSQNALAS